MDEDVVIKSILEANTPREVFGVLNTNDKHMLKFVYRSLQRAVHPDHNKHPQATEASAKLAQMHTMALYQLSHNTYSMPSPTLSLTSLHRYDIYDLKFSTLVADGYNCVIASKDSAIFSIVRSPKDNDLLEAEAKVLVGLKSDPRGKGFFSMFPDLVETLAYQENGYIRKANIYTLPEGYITLQQVLDTYPNGIPGQDMAWMFRRLLDLLGYVHSKGYIHGGIIPENILIRTGDLHETRLINWHGSVSIESDKSIPLLLGDEKWYPPEIKSKGKPYPASDLFMLATCMRYLVRDDEKAICGFVDSCRMQNIGFRPQQAWKLREEFTRLIEKLWGERKYRPFYLSNN